METHYRPSLLTGPTIHQHLAKGDGIGTHFHSAPAVRLADAKPLHLGHVVEADGRWRLFAFADDRRRTPTTPGWPLSAGSSRTILVAGALVVVRPDQHVAHVLPLDAFDELTSFFDASMTT